MFGLKTIWIASPIVHYVSLSLSLSLFSLSFFSLSLLKSSLVVYLYCQTTQNKRDIVFCLVCLITGLKEWIFLLFSHFLFIIHKIHLNGKVKVAIWFRYSFRVGRKCLLFCPIFSSLLTVSLDFKCCVKICNKSVTWENKVSEIYSHLGSEFITALFRILKSLL